MRALISYESLRDDLRARSRRWLVTGAAGFIGSHLARHLAALGQQVRGLDDFSGGRRENIADLKIDFVEGDIRDPDTCRRACAGVDIVLHHAAVASVVRSLEDPVYVDSVNSGGFLTLCAAAAESGVRRMVYASSSAVYGDGPARPRREDDALNPLSPYAVTKCANELYARTLAGRGGLHTVGLRYFNIYGPGQDPAGAYAAVIPKWAAALKAGQTIEIFGDGETVRDFCAIEDALQANVRAALTEKTSALDRVYNVGSGHGTTLNDLYKALGPRTPAAYRDFRAADIRHSVADISSVRDALGYEPSVTLAGGLARLMSS